MEFKKGHFVVKGRVQGVGFRYSTVIKANSIGITGYVRNRPDGSVETLAEGTSEQINMFLSYLEQGPSLSRVDEVIKSIYTADRRDYSQFQVTY